MSLFSVGLRTQNSWCVGQGEVGNHCESEAPPVISLLVFLSPTSFTFSREFPLAVALKACEGGFLSSLLGSSTNRLLCDNQIL